MSPLILLRIALAALARHRLRTALTTLGIATGIAATLCSVALGEGSAAAIHEDLVTLGDNLLWIQASVKGAGGVRDRAGGVAATLTAEDSTAIPQEVPEVTRCTPQVDSPVQVIHGNQNWRTTYRGVSADSIGEAFRAGAGIAWVVALAVVVHKFADGVSAVAILMSTGRSARTANAVLGAIALAPLAGLALEVLLPLPLHMLAYVLGWFAGVFLYLGAAALIPAAHAASPSRWPPAATLSGVALVSLVHRVSA